MPPLGPMPKKGKKGGEKKPPFPLFTLLLFKLLDKTWLRKILFKFAATFISGLKFSYESNCKTIRLRYPSSKKILLLTQ
jgi:hypothetical protein